MKKIILDTDIGDDIDDAFALALLLGSPEVQLEGVTTVFRNTLKRAQLAKKLINAAGAEVPVYAGERIPIKEPFHLFAKDGACAPEESSPCQWAEEYEAPVKAGAVDFLIEKAKELKGELTVLAIGPLTNLGRAIERDRAAMQGIGKIVLMGGSFSNHQPEWNILCDPEAAQTVIASGIPVYAVGLDVTLKCPLSEGLLDDFTQSGKEVNKLLSLWLKRWFDFFNFEKSVMHDPLAAATLLKEDICAFKQVYVKTDEAVRGALLVSDVPKEGYSPVYTADRVNRDEFYALIRERML